MPDNRTPNSSRQRKTAHRPELGNGLRQRREFLLSAQLVGPHGVHGACRFKLLGNDPQAFEQRSRAYLLDEREQLIRPVHYQVKGQGQTGYLQIEGVDTREAAQALKWFYLAIKRSEEPPLEPGVYYIQDLLGLAVYDQADQAFLGHVHEVLTHTHQEVFVIRLPGAADLLFVRRPETFVEVDLASGRLEVQLPEGLREIYR